MKLFRSEGPNGQTRRRAGLLFLVHGFELDEILPLLQAGAAGCLSRDAPVGNLARAIIAVGRGEIVLPPEYREALLLLAYQTDVVVVPVAGGCSPPEPMVTGWQGRAIKQLRRGLAHLQCSAPGSRSCGRSFAGEVTPRKSGLPERSSCCPSSSVPTMASKSCGPDE